MYYQDLSYPFRSPCSGDPFLHSLRPLSTLRCTLTLKMNPTKPLVRSSFLSCLCLLLVPDVHRSVDPSTSIPFPTTLQLPSKVPLPTFTLVGVGVRTVSFLGIKVYSVGFYADLQSPKLHVSRLCVFQSEKHIQKTMYLQISRSATADEKIEHIIRNSACVIRIGVSPSYIITEPTHIMN